MTNQSVAVVTGSPTGIGFEISLLLAGNGYRTFATMRDSTKADLIKNTAEKEHLPLEVVQMDVDKCESVKNALGKIIDEERRIDILANNVGYGLF
ncbi:MAG: SDR family NAD(P)-dependent oxidoreductase, partial [Nitrososphaeraceae archaeon]